MCDNLFGYPFFATFDSLGKILTGLKLLVTLGFPALNTGVIIAVFQTLGNNPPSMDWFIILVIGEVSASLFVLEKTVSIIYILCFGTFKSVKSCCHFTWIVDEASLDIQFYCFAIRKFSSKFLTNFPYFFRISLGLGDGINKKCCFSLS